MTRVAVSPLMISTAVAMVSTEKFRLRWNDFRDNVNTAFQNLRGDTDFSDVTLACEGNQQITAHKVILATSSPIFRDILKHNKNNHTLIYMKGVQASDLVSVVDFVYNGEANIFQEDLNNFLALAEELQLKGLEGEKGFQDEFNTESKNFLIKSFVPSKNPKVQHDVSLNDQVVTFIPPAENEMSVVAKIEHESMILDEQILSIMEKTDVGWKCKMCGKTDKHKGHVKEHIESKHTEGVSHYCNYCGKVLKDRHSLRSHIGSNHRNSQPVAFRV
jgi:hypothetical protein